MSINNIRILSEQVLILEIKKMPNVVISGIYKIENIINHKVYIGQSRNIVSRFKRGHLLPNVGEGTLLKNAIHKYGYENFTAEVILETYDFDYWEKFFIIMYHSNDRNFGYNMTDGGEGGPTFLGRHHTEETKRLMSLHSGLRGKIYTPEQRYAMGSRWRGKHFTEEQKRKMSERCKGINRYVKSEEHRRKIAETLKGNIPWNKGVPMTEEQRLKQIEIKREMYSGEKGEIIKQKLRDANEGLYYWNNGEIEIHSKEQPEGFSRGRLNAKDRRKYWYTNGKTDVKVDTCPKGFWYGRTFPNMKGIKWNNGKEYIFATHCPGEGFVKGELKEPGVYKFTKEHVENLKKSHAGLHWYTNGKENIRAKECPNGFWQGRITKHND